MLFRPVTAIAPYLAAIVSGAAALVYQVLWVRRLSATLGAGSYAVAVVLAVFFLGMGLGAFWGGRRADRTARPLHLYAALELVLAVWGAAFLLLTSAVEGAYFAVAPIEIDGGLHLVLKIVVSAAVLLLPCLAIGATTPVLVRGLRGPPERTGSRIAWLYGLNTLGAAAGSLIAIFLLLPALGLGTSLWVAAGGNLLAASLALAARKPEIAPSAVAVEPEAADPAPAPRDSLLLQVAAVSGFVGVAYEVLWTRGLAARFTSSVYSFALILSAFLVAIGVGSLLVAWLDRRGWISLRGCGWLLAGSGLAGIASMRGLELVTGTTKSHVGTSFAQAQWVEGLSALGVMVLPCLLLGATFPAVARAVHRERARLGRDLGRVYLVNTAGSVVAALIAGFVLLPALGLTLSMLLVGWIAVGFGMRVVGSSSATAGKPARSLASIGLVGVVVSALGFTDLRAVRDLQPNEVYIEGAAAAVAVLDRDGNRALWVNHSYRLGGSRGRYSQHRQGLLPVLLHPQPRRALLLGLGTGSSAGAVAAYGGLQVDAVEILPELRELLPQFEASNEGLVNRLGDDVRVLTLDARHFVRGTDRTYDVVISDLFTPWRAGEGAMYSLEHFRAVRDVLAERGLFCQWLPLYQLGVDELRTITATMLEAFPHVSLAWLYFDPAYPTVGLIGSAEPMRVGSERFAAAAPGTPRAALLAKNGLDDGVASVGACWIADTGRLRNWVSGVVPDTLIHPRNEFSAPRQHVVPRAERSRATVAAVLALESDEPAVADASEWFIELPEAVRRQAAGRAVAVAKIMGCTLPNADTLAQLEAAMASAPDWNWVAFNLEKFASAALARGSAEDVTRVSASLRATRSFGHIGHFLEAQLARRNGDLSAARRSLQDSLRLNPNYAPSLRVRDAVEKELARPGGR